MDRKDAMKSEKFLSIGEAALRLGVTTTTLRNWDKAGKLKPRRHPINGYRIYDAAEIEAINNAISGTKK